MAVTANTGTQTPVVTGETTIATITGGPFDNISVYFQGGSGGSGGAIGVNLYATVAGVSSRIASAQVQGSTATLGTLVEFTDTGGGATGTTSQSFNTNTSFIVDAGATTYTVKVIDLSAPPNPPGGGPRQPCTVTLAGVNTSDTAAGSPQSATFAPLAPGATGTLPVMAGYASQMDVSCTQLNVTNATITVLADCGGGSVQAVVRSQPFSGSSVVLASIFRNLHLPVATEYTVKVTNNSPSNQNMVVSAITYSRAAGASAGLSMVVTTVTATTPNVLSAMQLAGQLPATGIVPVRVEGFGGGGGGPGNQGSSPTAGGGGGASLYQVATIYIDLAHTFNATIGAGGARGLGTAAGSGLVAGDGGDGGVTEFTDVTAGSAIIWSAIGANGGTAQGSATGFSAQAGGNNARADLALTQPPPSVSTSGAIFPLHYLPGTGGHPGNNTGVPGGAGTPPMISLGGLFAGGAGGAAGGVTGNDGRGGGGGAAGPMGNGGAGGAGRANGSGLPGGNGADAAANTGAGGGAGGGSGITDNQNGSNGGNGGSGWMRMTFFVGATIV